jgi:hypothetical protein
MYGVRRGCRRPRGVIYRTIDISILSSLPIINRLGIKSEEILFFLLLDSVCFIYIKVSNKEASALRSLSMLSHSFSKIDTGTIG